MSKIGIGFSDGIANAETKMARSKVLGASLSTVNTIFSSPREMFFTNGELYLNDHEIVAKRFRSVLDLLASNNITPFIVEIGHDESWSEVDISDPKREITAETLDNLLAF